MPAKKAAKAPAKTPAKKPKAAGKATAPSETALVDQHIRDLGGWRGATLADVRRLIKQADPGMAEHIKWRKPSNPAGVPVWSHDGIVCTGETYKQHVRLTFMQGAALADPAKLFNANLVGVRRAIQLHEGDHLDPAAFKALVKQAVALNAEA